MASFYFTGYLNDNFLALAGSTPAGYYTTPSTPTPGSPGTLLRLKTGTESALPSVNGVIARNLLRLSSLLEDDKYRVLARQTCHSFAVEILQHPFLFVGLLDAIVGLETGTRNVTGVFSTANATASTSSSGPSTQEGGGGGGPPASSGRDALVKKIRAEAGLSLSTSATTVAALVDIRPSHLGDFVGNQSFWLRTRNQLFKDLKTGNPARNYLLVCEEGRCQTVDL